MRLDVGGLLLRRVGGVFVLHRLTEGREEHGVVVRQQVGVFRAVQATLSEQSLSFDQRVMCCGVRPSLSLAEGKQTSVRCSRGGGSFSPVGQHRQVLMLVFSGEQGVLVLACDVVGQLIESGVAVVHAHHHVQAEFAHLRIAVLRETVVGHFHRELTDQAERCKRSDVTAERTHFPGNDLVCIGRSGHFRLDRRAVGLHRALTVVRELDRGVARHRERLAFEHAELAGLVVGVVRSPLELHLQEALARRDEVGRLDSEAPLLYVADGAVVRTGRALVLGLQQLTGFYAVSAGRPFDSGSWRTIGGALSTRFSPLAISA